MEHNLKGLLTVLFVVIIASVYAFLTKDKNLKMALLLLITMGIFFAPLRYYSINSPGYYIVLGIVMQGSLYFLLKKFRGGIERKATIIIFSLMAFGLILIMGLTFIFHLDLFSLEDWK